MQIDKKLMHRIFWLIAGCIAFGWLLLDTARAKVLFEGIWKLFAPFVWGAGIAFVFNVPMRAIERQLESMKNHGLRRGLAIILTLAALTLVIMFVVELLVPQIQKTTASLAQRIPAFVERTSISIMAFMEENPQIQTWVMETFDLKSLDWPTLLGNALTFVGNQMKTMMGGAVTVIGNVTSALFNGIISIVFAIYCLGRKEILARQGRRILYSILPEKRTDEIIRILRLTNATFSNFISGQCLEAVILGCLFAVAMMAFGMPYASLVSVIIAVTVLVPVVGAFAGCILGAFFILVDSPFEAVTFVAMFLVIQQLENNLIYPRVVGTSIGLPGMWVLLAVTVGGGLMGVGGMLVMIPVASVCYTLAREFTNKRLAERNIPAEKLQHYPPEVRSRRQENADKKGRMRMQKMKEKFRKAQEQKKKNAGN